MENVKIRKATIKDKDQILEFCRHTWESEEYGEFNESKRDYIQFVYDTWVRKKSLLTLEFEDKPVAILNVSECPDGSVWLEGLRVSPAYRRRGFASLITKYAIGNHKIARMAVFDWNLPSKSLVSSLGGKIIEKYIYYDLQNMKGERNSCKFAKDPQKIFELTGKGKNGIFVDWKYFYPDFDTIDSLVRKRSIIEDEDGFGTIIRSEEEITLVIDNAKRIDNLVNFFVKKYGKKKKFLMVSQKVENLNRDFLKSAKKVDMMNIYEINQYTLSEGSLQ